jgi:hypothetical protein
MKYKFNKNWSRFILTIDLIIWFFETHTFRKRVIKNNKKKVIFCDLLNMYSTSKIEAIFAAALSLEGFNTIVLLPNRSWLIEKIFMCTCKVNFVYLNELITNQVREIANNEAKKIISKCTDLNKLMNIEIDGFQTGRHVLSSVIRRSRQSSLNISNPKNIIDIEKTLAESIAACIVARALIRRIKPELAIFLEKGYTPAGEIYDACLLENINTVQWIAAPNPGHLIFKRFKIDNRTDHPISLGDDTWKMILTKEWGAEQEKIVLKKISNHYGNGTWFNRQQLHLGKKIISKDDLRSRLCLEEGRKVAVIFSHVLYDATFFYGESLFDDYEQWLIETVRCAIANTNLDWIIKVHPVNVWRSRMDRMPVENLETRVLYRVFGDLPDHIRFMPADTDINTFSFFSAIDYGLTVRGTIGMELPCYGIPVVTAGTGRYSGKGFTIDPDSRENYFEILSSLHLIAPLSSNERTLALKYAFGTFFMKQIPHNSFKINYDAFGYGTESLKIKVKTNPKLLEKWPNLEDLNKITNWAVNSNSTDMVSF